MYTEEGSQVLITHYILRNNQRKTVLFLQILFNKKFGGIVFSTQCMIYVHLNI